MNTERVEAASKAFDKAFAEEMLSGRSPSANDWKVAGLRAALAAADATSGERVIYRGNEDRGVAVFNGTIEVASDRLNAGEELVVRKVRGT